MLVVSDLTDLFLPCPDDLLVNLAESRTVVEALLTNLPGMFRGTRSVDSALGSALNAAGRVMVSSTECTYLLHVFELGCVRVRSMLARATTDAVFVLQR
jgi:Sec23/Sec24 trunk domain